MGLEESLAGLAVNYHLKPQSLQRFWLATRTFNIVPSHPRRHAKPSTDWQRRQPGPPVSLRCDDHPHVVVKRRRRLFHLSFPPVKPTTFTQLQSTNVHTDQARFLQTVMYRVACCRPKRWLPQGTDSLWAARLNFHLWHACVNRPLSTGGFVGRHIAVKNDQPLSVGSKKSIDSSVGSLVGR